MTRKTLSRATVVNAAVHMYTAGARVEAMQAYLKPHRVSYNAVLDEVKRLGIPIRKQANVPFYAEDTLLAVLKKKAEKLGRTPTYSDFCKDSKLPSPSTYVKRFGTWKKACTLAGLEPNNGGPIKRTQ